MKNLIYQILRKESTYVDEKKLELPRRTMGG